MRVNPRAAARVAAGHPWIYRSDLLHAGGAGGGQVVDVLDGRNNPLGTAHYSSSSQIALRMLPGKVRDTGSAFFLQYIQRAQAYRRQVVAGTSAYRAVYSEGDLLPGLLVDRYGNYLVIQTVSQGMDASKEAILAALTEIYSPAGILERNDIAVRAKEQLPRLSGVLRGSVPAEIEVEMNGLSLGVDPLHGQKTGLYLDQRENYQAARRYAHGLALDCFTGAGGFALHLASCCPRVEAVDSSQKALQAARNNAQRNALANIEFREANVFDLLQQYAAAQRRFQTVILDPPSFAKSRRQLEGAARGYKDINLRALRLLEPGGVLVTCSCSHHFSEADLLEVVAAASLDTGQQIRVLERRTQARDHPILLTVPETHYLKCLILQVV